MAQRLAERDAVGFSRSLLARRVGGDYFALTNDDVVAAFHQCDPWTVQLIRTVARPLGQTLAAVHASVGTERFVIYGGFALALGSAYRNELVEAAARCCWDMGQDWDRMIELGHADDYSGLIGAGRYITLFNKRGLVRKGPEERALQLESPCIQDSEVA
jgi:glucokinase